MFKFWNSFQRRRTKSDTELLSSDGYPGSSIHIQASQAVSKVTRDSMRSKSTRRISWGISKRNGFNVSVEDLRHRSTKIVVLGKGNVGKTAFVVRFVTKRFIGEYPNDKHTCYEHDALYGDGESHRFEILDLSNAVLQKAETEKAEREFEEHIKWGDAFLLLYSVVDMSSFHEITRLAFLISFLHKNSSPKPILTLIGTKIDLEDQRLVSELEGKKLAESIGARFAEVSAAETHLDIERIFRESADSSRFSFIKTPLLMRRASGATGSSFSQNSLPRFRSSGTLSFAEESEEESI